MQLKKYSIKNALDLGCGKGRIALKLAENKINVLGIDVKDCLIQHEKFRFIKEDLRDFKFEEKFDLIVCSQILHFFNPKEILCL